MARLYREAPLNSVWEGSGNVNALDVVRVLTRSPGAVEALLEELERARGAHRRWTRPSTTCTLPVGAPTAREIVQRAMPA